jgi:DNA helicase II / ATP-dependent DNA helicase PcrA
MTVPGMEKLNPAQREAVLHMDGPLLILAGAGSGKTRVIVHRIANLIDHGVAPWNILAVTFTNKAAGEMRNRVDGIVPGYGRSVWVSTFHSFCAKFLRIEAKNAGMDPNFVIYDDNDQSQVIKDILKEMMISDKQTHPNQVLAAISRAKDELLDADSYAIHAQAHADPFRERVGAIYQAYEKKLRAANALDFGDLIMKAVHAFRDVEIIREKYQRRFQYLMVDEYQDTNHAQYLLTKYIAGPAKNICVVGDDDQSIYSWRGATIRNILEFERDYPGAKVVKLEQNYRSTKKILGAAGKLIKLNTRRKEKELWTQNDEGEDVTFTEMANEHEEARFVIDEVAKLKDTGRFELKDMAVFYRTNSQSRVFEDALRRRAMPYIIIGALRFYERAEIKDAIAYLRAIVNPKDSLSVKRVVNLPARGLGKNSLGLLEQYAAAQGISLWEALLNENKVSGLSSAARNGVRAFVAMMGQFQQMAVEHGASTSVRRMLEESGYWDMWASKVDEDPEAGERLDNLQELINAAKDFEERARAAFAGPPNEKGESVVAPQDAEDTAPTLARFLQEISLMSDLDEWKEQGGALTLMTVHLAKGLEFPGVFVTGLEEGLFPIGDAAFDPEELEEERRLAYVAMTRAKNRLYLTSAASRRIFGTPRMNIPSRFVQEAGIQKPTRPQRSYDVFSGMTQSDAAFAETASQVRSEFNQAADVTEDFNQDVSHDAPPAAPPRVVRIPRVGQKVRHPDFGIGTILDVEGSGDHAKASIVFPGGLKKKLLLKYAPLEFITGR